MPLIIGVKSSILSPCGSPGYTCALSGLKSLAQPKYCFSIYILENFLKDYEKICFLHSQIFQSGIIPFNCIIKDEYRNYKGWYIRITLKLMICSSISF